MSNNSNEEYKKIVALPADGFSSVSLDMRVDKRTRRKYLDRLEHVILDEMTGDEKSKVDYWTIDPSPDKMGEYVKVLQLLYACLNLSDDLNNDDWLRAGLAHMWSLIQQTNKKFVAMMQEADRLLACKRSKV